ncbi:MAG: EAL domain-containing protein, partial [Gammaproteobacteria bacterium]|nr:EAL domain-containing protein [Gammaproteobacteria bacterium]
LTEKTKQLQATLENMGQGISMFDADLRLVAFNQRFVELLEFPPDLVRKGESLETLFRYNAQRGEYGPGDSETLVRERMDLARRFEAHCFRRTRPNGTVLEIRGNPLPSGDGFVTTYTDVTEAHELSRQITHQATHDALTGLINRWEFERRLERVIETTRRDGSQHALCFLDLDQFKVINDTCGHVAGDSLLRQLGELLPECVRRRDTLARLGGDEFGVLMEHCDLANAERVAGALRREVESLQFQWEDKRFKLGISIGVVPIGPETHSANEVLSSADAAVYAAKDQGRNQIHVYLPGDDELVRRHGEMQWVTRLTRAMDEDRLRLYFQRIFPADAIPSATEGGQRSADRGRLRFELLLRMEDEQGQLVSPAAFLPSAERYNLSRELDFWVVKSAFGWLARTQATPQRIALCSVNLSAASLGDERLMKFVLDRLREGPIRGSQICFEITETAAIGQLARARNFISTLNAEGVRFALDDFGSGFSSFSYLKTLPLEYLKIDGAFVRDVHRDPMGLAMVKSINDIGHILGKQTIAEFVESDAVLAKVRKLGVDFVQGYAFGYPEPIENLPALAPGIASGQND